MNSLEDPVPNFAGLNLYYFATCPFCLIVRFYLWRKGIRLPLRDIHRNAQHARDLQEQGGKTQVPCLKVERSDGEIRWLYESAEIVKYLQTQLHTTKCLNS